MLDFAAWLGTTILVLMLKLAAVVRAAVEWLHTPTGLAVLAVVLAAVWLLVLYVYRRRRRAVDELAAAVDEEGTTTA